MNSTTPSRLIVVDDHQLFREVIVEKLNGQDDISVVAELDNALDALSKVKELQPDMLLMDIALEGVDGLDAAQMIKQSGLDCKLLVVSMHSEWEYVQKAKAIPVDAYVRKQEAFQDLLEAIAVVRDGGSYFSAGLSEQLSDNPYDITEREQEIIVLIAEGLSNKQMASQCGLSIKTIETHRSNIYRKLNMRNSADITRFALRQGWLTL